MSKKCCNMTLYQKDFYEEKAEQLQIAESHADKFYVYLHRRLSDNKVFYVGKGCGKRAWTSFGRGTRWNRVVAKHGISVEIVFSRLDEEESYLLEMDTIAEMRYFGEPLVNHTSGGLGAIGVSKETREKMSKAKIGITPHNKGKKFPEKVGIGNSSADKSIYKFMHDSGEIIIGTRYDVISKYNLSSVSFGKLFYKSDPRKKVFGWQVLEKISDGN